MLGSRLEKHDLQQFLFKMKDEFYPDQDSAFIEYSLELCDEKNKDEFIVPHTKLIELGIATSARSDKMKERLTKTLELVEDVDFIKRRTLVQLPSGAKHKNDYFMKPYAFKKCLMRARKDAAQDIDIAVYADYFIFVEEVVYHYMQYQLAFAQENQKRMEALLEGKDEKIDSLKDEIRHHRTEILMNQKLHMEQSSALQELHQKQLQEAMSAIAGEASRQRVEILHETKAAKDEAKAAKHEVELAREDISELHTTVIDQHADMIAMAQHMSVEVSDPSKRQYFAMTAFSRVGDESGRIYFRTFRAQAKRIMTDLMKMMTVAVSEEIENHETNVMETIMYTTHYLVIPPIYFPGSVNVGVTGKSNLDALLNSARPYLTGSTSRKVPIGRFSKSIGIASGSLKPIWTPNDYINHCAFVDCFLDPIKSTKIVDKLILPVKASTLKQQIDAIDSGQFREFINMAGESRERLEEMISAVRIVLTTPPNSDDETDRERSDSE